MVLQLFSGHGHSAISCQTNSKVGFVAVCSCIWHSTGGLSSMHSWQFLQATTTHDSCWAEAGRHLLLSAGRRSTCHFSQHECAGTQGMTQCCLNWWILWLEEEMQMTLFSWSYISQSKLALCSSTMSSMGPKSNRLAPQRRSMLQHLCSSQCWVVSIKDPTRSYFWWPGLGWADWKSTKVTLISPVYSDFLSPFLWIWSASGH